MSASQKFFHAYVMCALWSSTDNADESGGEPLDANYGSADIAEEAQAKMRADCDAFVDANARDLRRYVEAMGWDGEARAGHDFWLTRNRHGAGFWDRGLGELGNRLTDASHAFGECDLYVGDDGRLYIS
jgi:hypothetical protein